MQELQRRMSSAKAWGIDDVSRSSRRREVKELVPYIDESVIVGGFYTPVRRHRRLAALRDDHARARAGAGRAAACSRTPRCSGSTSSTAACSGIRTSRGDIATEIDRRLLRRLEPEDRAHGRRDDPADAGGAPDDRRRPGAALQGHEGRDRVPDRPRHGHEHVRAPGRERARDRLVRPPRRSSTTRRRSRRTRRRRSRRPSSRSRRRTSSSRWRTRSS